MPVEPQSLPDVPRAELPAAEPTPVQSELAYPAAAAPPAREPDGLPDGVPLWAQRMSLFILVIFCVYLGVIVTVLPWWHAVWDFNGFFLSHPRLWAVMRLGPVRGIISGCGLIDIWIGVSEAVHYREHRR